MTESGPGRPARPAAAGHPVIIYRTKAVPVTPPATPAPRPPLRPWLLGLPLVVAALLVAALYWRTCARVIVGGGDSGDFIAAAACNGIPHPSGYPLYITLAHPLLLLTDGISPAFVLNLFSAVCALATVIVLMLVVRRLTASPLAAALAGLWFAVGTPFWSQAVRAEVYTLHTLLVIITLGGALGMLRSPRPQWWYLAGLGCVLGLGNHLMILTLAPALLYAAWRRRPPFKLMVRAQAVGVILLAVLYGGMMLRAAAQPASNWCDPSTPARLLDTITLNLYSEMRTGNLDLDVKLGSLWSGALGQFGVAGLLLVGLGAAAWWHERRHEGALLLLALLAPLAAVLLLFSQRDAATLAHAIGNHWLTAYVVMGVLLGCGLEVGLRLTRVYAVVAGCVAALGMIVIQAHANWPANDLANYDDVGVFTYNILVQAPPGAVLLTHSDMTEFPLRYFLQADKVNRQDLAVVNVRLLGYDWYYPRAGLAAPAGANPAAKRAAALAELLAREVAGRGVYIACEAIPEELLAGYTLQPYGLLDRVVPEGRGAPDWPENRKLLDQLIQLLPVSLFCLPPPAELEPRVMRGNIALALRRGADLAIANADREHAVAYIQTANALKLPVSPALP